MAEEPSSKRTLPIVPIVVVAAVVGLFLFLESRPASQGGGRPPTVAAGKAIYMNLCSVCHHRDPNKGMGGLGPPITGSPFELVQMRVLKTKYPEGYTPKRKTTLMPTFPSLKGRELRSIHMFLEDAKNNPPK